ncbi:GNAT family N-acetyltransferase [Roseimarinus sediminis]|uniref:GNAT family N-acetyltransferase n=1 Tax=Roseimarinus sediminis TaxID=1610899 RepID=UPI003D1D75D7
MELFKANQKQYALYRSQLVDLYVEAFMLGDAFQYIDRNEAYDYFDRIAGMGEIVLATASTSLKGALLAVPLSFDELVPESISKHFLVERSVYIAELMVKADTRGQGTGSQLLHFFLENTQSHIYHDAFIRVWTENEAAMRLYRKAGFVPLASIVQAKWKADRSGMFDFHKTYLHRKL